MKGLFLHNPADLNAPISGGVQICSQEFLKIIRCAVNDLYLFEVKHSRSLYFRLLYKLNLDSYKSYNTEVYKEALRNIILEQEITHVFINKSELLKFSKVIRQLNLPFRPFVIVLSHGNESGDLLGDLRSKDARFKGFLKIAGIVKLGATLFTESWYRKRFVDLVCTMSDEESAIEKWLGMNAPFLLPRVIAKDETNGLQNAMHKTQDHSTATHHNTDGTPVRNIFGYTGTLDHTPNLSALNQLFEVLKSSNLDFEIRIIGRPTHIGLKLEREYPFVKYLGNLDEDSLLKEIQDWSFLINPIFNYSRGASMKLMKAIEWEIPVITTTAGRRGYVWKEGSLIETAESPEMFAAAMTTCLSDQFNYDHAVNEIISVKNSSPSALELGKRLGAVLANLGT